VRGQGGEDEQPAAVGLAAPIASLDRASRRRLYHALLGFAAVALVIIARAFPGELLRGGRAFSIAPYLLIQWSSRRSPKPMSWSWPARFGSTGDQRRGSCCCWPHL